MTFSRASLCICFATLLVSCADKPRPVDTLGEAYVAPSTLNLRRELALKSAVAATVKHGEKLDIVEYRHRLVKVRTEHGVEGWTDMRQLLTPEQMAELQDMAKDAARALSQGQATVFEMLNMHTAPNRTSPSFAQIPENGKVDVIAHKLTPRVQREEVSTPAPVKVAPVRKKKAKAASTKIGPPPRPPVPKVPENWVALSVPKLGPEPPPADLQPPVTSTAEAEKAPAAPPPPVAMDDWDLVRTQDGKVGWVLMRPLSMAIPDEVAQYAEGHRITSYFPLGQVRDGDTVKNNWLWTTIIKGGEPYEYDSFRVFVWSIRHHRYETAYVERNIVGHYPVQVTNTGDAPSFAVVVEGIDGHWYRKTYTFDSYRIHMVNRELYDPAKKAAASKIASNAPVSGQGEPKRSWYASLKDRVHRFLR